MCNYRFSKQAGGAGDRGVLASGLYLLTISAGGGLLMLCIVMIIFRECSGSRQRLFSPSLSLALSISVFLVAHQSESKLALRGVEAAAIHPSPTKPGPQEIRGRDDEATTQNQLFHR